MRRSRFQYGLVVERLEDRVLLAPLVQVNYFDNWHGGVIPSTDVAGITYHPSGQLYLADSEINEIVEFQGKNIFSVSPDGQQLHQEFATDNLEPTGITFNEYDGFFYITNDDTKTLQRYDSNLDHYLTRIFTTTDVPNATDPEGVTSDPATGNLYVIDGHGGGTQVLAYDSNLNFEYSFSVSAELFDPEGIAFNPNNKHLFVVSDVDHLIAEYTLNGIFVESYSISGLTPSHRAVQGLTFGPTSDPLDSSANLALYLADGGIDNFADGGIYETLVSGGQLAQNTAPLVNAGHDKVIVTGSFPLVVN